MTVKVEFNEDEAQAVLAALDEFGFMIDPRSHGVYPTEEQLREDPVKYRLGPHPSSLKLVAETLNRVSKRIKAGLGESDASHIAKMLGDPIPAKEDNSENLTHDAINELIYLNKSRGSVQVEHISDGQRTFGFYYKHMAQLFLAVCRMDHYHTNWTGETPVWRSRNYSDGIDMGNYFALGIDDDIVYCLPIERWEETNFARTLDKALACPADSLILEALKCM